ncbi:MAG: putative lipid II flippase FtsW [Chlamydiae bacterium]|nr:putative lipid II flippase FtsW [Chlamydiota bacterium]
MKQLRYLDFSQIVMLFLVMCLSLILIASVTMDHFEQESKFFTPYVLKQLRWFILGWGIYVLVCLFDYHKLKDLAPILYGIVIVSLVGLFFMSPVRNVFRWYRLPFLGFDIQPSEVAKCIVVIMLAWFIDRNKARMHTFKNTSIALIIGLIPFVLILKQPDLGTALILLLMLFGMLSIAGANRFILRSMVVVFCICFVFIAALFLEIVPHSTIKPMATKIVKEYQFERLNPKTYHQKAALNAIGLGAFLGTGFRKSDFSTSGWLPTAHTDSVFCVLGEQFGLLGMYILIGLLYFLGYLGFRSASSANDYFGYLLGFGMILMIMLHGLLNIAMMCGVLPISGVPLVLVSYGGSQILVVMGSLGLVQSIFIRRFRF